MYKHQHNINYIPHRKHSAKNIYISSINTLIICAFWIHHVYSGTHSRAIER